MKRSWKAVPNLFDDSGDNVFKLFHHYKFAFSCVGNGWKHGEISGFGIYRSTDNYTGSHLERLSSITADFREYIFGHAAYDLKNETEPVQNKHPNADGFPHSFFFIPRLVVCIENSEWQVGFFEEKDLAEFEQHLNSEVAINNATCRLHLNVNWKNYEEHCRALLHHIQRGDIYEINYCVDFTGKSKSLNPVKAFQQLNGLTEAPMSCLYRN